MHVALLKLLLKFHRVLKTSLVFRPLFEIVITCLGGQFRKLSKSIFEHFETARKNGGNFKILKSREGNLFLKSLELNMWLLVNDTKLR